jgi:hypothetical protein
MMEVSTLSMGDPVEVDAIEKNEGDPSDQGKSKVKSEIIEVTLRNTGWEPGLFVGANFKIVESTEFEDCVGGGGPVSITGIYDVSIPNPLPRLPHVIEHKLTPPYQVKPHEVDRLVFKIGPAKFYESDPPRMYQIDISLRQEDSRLLRLGSVVMIATMWYDARIYLVPDPVSAQPLREEEACMKRNANTVKRFAQLSDNRSPEIEELLRLAKRWGA